MRACSVPGLGQAAEFEQLARLSSIEIKLAGVRGAAVRLPSMFSRDVILEADRISEVVVFLKIQITNRLSNPDPQAMHVEEAMIADLEESVQKLDQALERAIEEATARPDVTVRAGPEWAEGTGEEARGPEFAIGGLGFLGITAWLLLGA